MENFDADKVCYNLDFILNSMKFIVRLISMAKIEPRPLL